MSHSDVLLGEVETLRRLRRHRADRAERALREAKRAQLALLAHIQQAQDALERTRQEEAQQSAQLLNQHQGQVITLQALKSWGRQERSLSANTQREMGQLEALRGQREEKQASVGSAQKQVTECLRQVEKLQELSLLLAQEPT
ncbi:YscO family type III secretion system apparatus protein [Pseudomonas sp. Wu6]|jgi:chromosome segregation ATPase|uniref:type III secretion system stalk subunit SctO n=1 Tax=unclassified Pseudomonas TaxID=196821 RepID=UPI0008120059|nr:MULTISPECIES: YscO family type III secretion system apparatus protein [unclassified Pseudomonas]MBY8929621.1 YscO family type III secretion system apparatus protein [Pseudomonas sp. Wu6]CRM99582.1 Type III secretion protein YscO [Pseudomonas sp. 34 E 7]